MTILPVTGLQPYYLNHALLNQGDTQWGNLGYWATATTYPQAAAALARRLGEAAALQPSDQVLEVGFGAGESLRFWAEEYGLTQWVGQEIVPEYIQLARDRTSAGQLIQGGSLAHFRPELFDKILALDCAYHFRPRAQFLAQAWATLKPGGRLALTDLALVHPPQAALTRLMLRGVASLTAIPPENFLTLTAYHQQLQAQGYRHIRLDCLEAQVFRGFAHFVYRHAQRYLRQSPQIHWLKLLATGVALAYCSRHEWLHYVLITADKPLLPGASHP